MRIVKWTFLNVLACLKMMIFLKTQLKRQKETWRNNSMSWNYAELSKIAKAAGGPEKLLAIIEEGGKAVGRIEGQTSMIPWIGIAAAGASALTAGILKLSEHLKAKKVISQAAVDAAKAELIQGIKEYDASHPEQVESVSEAIPAIEEVEKDHS